MLLSAVAGRGAQRLCVLPVCRTVFCRHSPDSLLSDRTSYVFVCLVLPTLGGRRGGGLGAADAGGGGSGGLLAADVGGRLGGGLGGADVGGRLGGGVGVARGRGGGGL